KPDDYTEENLPTQTIIQTRQKTSTGSAKSGNFPGRKERFGTTHSSAPLRSNKSTPRFDTDRQFAAPATFPQSKTPRCRSSFPDGGINVRPISKIATRSAPARMFRSSTATNPTKMLGRSAT